MFDYTDLLGKEFAYGGRGPEAYDCWGLCEEIYRRLGRPCPSYFTPADRDRKSVAAAIEYCAIMDNFRRLSAPEPFCFVTFTVRRPYVSHVGIVMEDCRTFLHIMAKSRVTRERLDSIVWRDRVRGYYRWEDGKP